MNPLEILLSQLQGQTPAAAASAAGQQRRMQPAARRIARALASVPMQTGGPYPPPMPPPRPSQFGPSGSQAVDMPAHPASTGQYSTPNNWGGGGWTPPPMAAGPMDPSIMARQQQPGAPMQLAGAMPAAPVGQVMPNAGTWSMPRGGATGGW
jgi:hypothetical protein